MDNMTPQANAIVSKLENKNPPRAYDLTDGAEHQRLFHELRAWAQRNPKLPNTGENAGKNPTGITCIEADQLPIPCDCFYCGEPAVIFPPEDGTDPRGMCICPCCSGSQCSHKNGGARVD